MSDAFAVLFSGSAAIKVYLKRSGLIATILIYRSPRRLYNPVGCEVRSQLWREMYARYYPLQPPIPLLAG